MLNIMYMRLCKSDGLKSRKINIRLGLDPRVKIRSLRNEAKIRMRAWTKEELAKKFGITLEELEKLKSPDFYEGIAK